MELHLKMLQDATKSSSDLIKEVTNVRTIARVMNESDVYKKNLTDVEKILKIYLPCHAATTATAERSFSLLRTHQDIFEV